MPDPLFKSVSASNVAGLWNLSPYVTRWMLWQQIAHQRSIDGAEDNRMSWGKKMQPLLLAAAVDDLGFNIVPNDADRYIRAGQLGCTRDADVICPDRGPGPLETKCCFDYRQWMERWAGGERLPPDIEMQLQCQMLVGDGEQPFSWGVIAVWVCGEMRYFERKPDLPLWDAMREEAARFFEEVASGQEPDPFGLGVEMPLLKDRWPEMVKETLDLSGDPASGELFRLYEWASREKSRFGKLESELKAKVLAVLKDAEQARAPGALVYQKRSERKGSVIRLPVNQAATLKMLADQLEAADMQTCALELREVAHWEQETRKPSTSVSVDVRLIEEDLTAPADSPALFG